MYEVLLLVSEDAHIHLLKMLTESSGAGQYVGHWGGDNEAKWGAMFLSISQSFIFQMGKMLMNRSLFMVHHKN